MRNPPSPPAIAWPRMDFGHTDPFFVLPPGGGGTPGFSDPGTA